MSPLATKCGCGSGTNGSGSVRRSRHIPRSSPIRCSIAHALGWARTPQGKRSPGPRLTHTCCAGCCFARIAAAGCREPGARTGPRDRPTVPCIPAPPGTPALGRQDWPTSSDSASQERRRPGAVGRLDRGLGHPARTGSRAGRSGRVERPVRSTSCATRGGRQEDR